MAGLAPVSGVFVLDFFGNWFSYARHSPNIGNALQACMKVITRVILLTAVLMQPSLVDASSDNTPFVITDLSSVALLTTGLLLNSGDPGDDVGYSPRPIARITSYVGTAGYVLGGPIIHAARNDWGRAGLSLGLRAGMPALVPAVAALTGHEIEFWHVAAIPIGMVGAIALDWLVLARRTTNRPMMFRLKGSF